MEYRVTKYDPKLRDIHGRFLVNEWTSFSDIGTSVTEIDYEATEKAYIETALAMLEETDCKGLFVVKLESTGNEPDIREGDYLELQKLETAFRCVLREEAWCRFENLSHFVHFGYDFYMYVGTPEICSQAIEFAKYSGLYVEDFRSPYND